MKWINATRYQDTLLANAAAILTGFVATLVLVPPGDARTQDPNCKWATVNQYYGPECVTWAPAQDCSACCLHYHLGMNVPSCLAFGDELKGAKTKKFFTAQYKLCTPHPVAYACIDGTPAQAPCDHYAWQCSTVSCE